jgi:hypothetical protein
VHFSSLSFDDDSRDQKTISILCPHFSSKTILRYAALELQQVRSPESKLLWKIMTDSYHFCLCSAITIRKAPYPSTEGSHKFNSVAEVKSLCVIEKR